jgi:hypothetical protein
MIKLKVWAQGANEYRTILENERGHVASMTFRAYDELVCFILDMGVTYVAVMHHNQSALAYGTRIDDQMLKDSISVLQSMRRGKNRRIEVGVE